MKVLVIGGTGAFGLRLCDLLARDGHVVTIASRSVPKPARSGPDPTAFAHRVFDRAGPLTGFDAYDVIVDAAGPFHAYGNDPYRVARAAIDAGAHYLDLSDNADFCQGLSALDAQAKAAGLCAYSGMSSVPAISSAAVTALCDGQTPLMIESAILPGNKAPRGRAVIESILHQTGRDYTVKQAGRDVAVRSWSDPRWYDLGPYQRQGWRIEVPDQRLFPDHFNCPTVAFRASLELGVMRYGLAALSYVRSHLGFNIPGWMVSAVMFGARLLAPFGTDRGGMVVEVTVPQGPEFIRKTWVLRAKNGDGPYTPAIAVRAACRDITALPTGAGPSLSLLPLDKIEACFDDLNIETETTVAPLTPLFRQVLGAAFDTLAPAVTATHDAVTPRRLTGVAQVTRGRGIEARIAAILFGFPPSGDGIEVEVTKNPKGGAETWVRRFGRATFRSVLRPTPRGMSERFGALTFDLDLTAADGQLHYPVKGGRIWGLAIPRALLPQSIASEAEVDGRFHFDVDLRSPFGARLVHYRGWLKEDAASDVTQR